MLEDLLLPGPLQSIPDVVAVGTQETNGDRDEWEIGLQETLGPSHVLFHSIELGTLHLAVFLRRDLIWVCSGNLKAAIGHHNKLTHRLISTAPTSSARSRLSQYKSGHCVPN